MSARDELADLLHDVMFDGEGIETNWTLHGIADTILTGGYSRPCVVTTIEELQALPEGAVVMWDDYGNQTVAIINEGDCIGHTANDYWNSRIDRIGLPATVIHLPEETP